MANRPVGFAAIRYPKSRQPARVRSAMQQTGRRQSVDPNSDSVMKKEEIHLTDWQRIFLGEVPGEFYIELLIRVVVVYLILVVAMRLMGRRMASQLSRTEMIAMVSLAASVGIPVLAPDRGLLPAIISALVIVAIQQLLARQTSRNEEFETLINDDMDVLMNDGALNLAEMQSARVTRERLFAQLRSEGLSHLGSVKLMLMEADGKFTLIRQPDPKPGLSVLPEWDREFTAQQKKAPGHCVCNNCGNHKQASVPVSLDCERCGNNNWVPAVS